MTKLKQCAHCGKEKSAQAFHKNKSRKDNLAAYCKLCKSKKEKDRMRKRKINRGLGLEKIELPNYIVCHTCKESKPVNNFYKNILCPTGFSGQCKECRKVCARETRERQFQKAKKLPVSITHKCCSACGKFKALDEMVKWAKAPDGTGASNNCRVCVRERSQDYYQRNKKKINARSIAHSKKMREWFRELKKQFSCETCSENHPACLVFHHKDPSKKEVEVCGAMQLGWSRERILREIEKCIILCANCHRKLHWDQKQKAKQEVK